MIYIYIEPYFNKRNNNISDCLTCTITILPKVPCALNNISNGKQWTSSKLLFIIVYNTCKFVGGLNVAKLWCTYICHHLKHLTRHQKHWYTSLINKLLQIGLGESEQTQRASFCFFFVLNEIWFGLNFGIKYHDCFILSIEFQQNDIIKIH